MPKPKKIEVKFKPREPIFLFKPGAKPMQVGYMSHGVTSGFYHTVWDWMSKHPGERLPSKQIAKKFGRSENSVRIFARKVQATQGFAKRRPGGPNRGNGRRKQLI